jgi:iron complex outermembrane receptor protein
MYENVIKEEAENAGERRIYGGEFRSFFNFKNIIPKSPIITGYLFYSYTQAISSIHYDHAAGDWVKGETLLGDIAPHKINAGLNIPILKAFNLNVRGNFVSERLVYSENALRVRNYKIAPYFTMDAALSCKYKVATLSVKVKNLTDASYFHPGLEQADSGDDFSKRSLGYRNSLLPQAGRTFMLSLNIEI